MIVLLGFDLTFLDSFWGVGIDPLEGNVLFLEVVFDLDAIGAPVCADDFVAHFW